MWLLAEFGLRQFKMFVDGVVNVDDREAFAGAVAQLMDGMDIQSARNATEVQANEPGLGDPNWQLITL